MARKKSTSAPAEIDLSLTPERATRLYQFLSLLESGPKTRPQLEKKLKIGLRTFYRDLEVLRAMDIDVATQNKKHVLNDRDWKSKLRVPDPCLSFAEAEALASGKSAANKKIAAMVADLTR